MKEYWFFSLEHNENKIFEKNSQRPVPAGDYIRIHNVCYFGYGGVHTAFCGFYDV